MLEFLESLETTAIGEWVAVSQWGYAITLASHGLGMAVVVGMTAIIALRILGYPKGIPLQSLRSLLPVMIIGMVLNALSGIALFIAAASQLFYNTAFQLKMLAIVIGLAMIVFLDKQFLKPAAVMTETSTIQEPGRNIKVLAFAIILIWWVSVVLSGRLIAYVGG